MSITKKYCLQQTNNNIKEICYSNTAIKLNSLTSDQGYLITYKTIDLKSRERKHLRLTNTYTFNNKKIMMIWNNEVSMINISNSMKMFPKLSEIWITINGKNITGTIPANMIMKMKNEINSIIGEQYVTIDNINLDQLEILKTHNIFNHPETIIEKLLIYSDLKMIASEEILTFTKEKPDNIELMVTIESNKSDIIV